MVLSNDVDLRCTYLNLQQELVLGCSKEMQAPPLEPIMSVDVVTDEYTQ
jgi:hypothetical protein